MMLQLLAATGIFCIRISSGYKSRWTKTVHAHKECWLWVCVKGVRCETGSVSACRSTIPSFNSVSSTKGPETACSACSCGCQKTPSARRPRTDPRYPGSPSWRSCCKKCRSWFSTSCFSDAERKDWASLSSCPQVYSVTMKMIPKPGLTNVP